MLSAKPDKHAFPLVRPLFHFRRGDLGLAGGKGANLGELSSAGFNVPPGFVITTAAYDLLVQSNGFPPRLSGMLSSFKMDDPDNVADMSQKIQALFRKMSVPSELTDEILRAYHQLGDGAVAVRSSATAEDLPEAAFAGQQETFLNIVGEQDLMEAVQACWMSLWSERAILYRARQNVEQQTVKLAVVVQTMVFADMAGVLFTANPVSGERNELVIDANPGLGEAVVGGLVTPDHFVLDKRRFRIIDQRLGKREVVVRPKAGGGTEQVTLTEAATNRTVLPPHTLRKLSQLAIAIEEHYNAPQDIEWAWIEEGTKAGRLFILQARPLTALPEPLKVNGPMRLVIPMLAEMWPTRPYPLDMTTFTGEVERAIGNLLVTIIGKSAPNPDESFVEEDGVVIHFQPPKLHPSPSMVFMPWIALWITRHYDPAHWQSDPLLEEFISRARAIEQRNLQLLPWTQIMDTLREALGLIPRAMQLREHYLPQALLALASLQLLLALARRRDCFGALVSGVKTKTTETNQALEDLATQIRAAPALQGLFHRVEANELWDELEASQPGRAFLEQFKAFLSDYGHRELTLTISQPAWKDQPEIVLGLLKLLAETEPEQRDSDQAWQSTRDALLAHSILGTRILRGPFLKSLTNARALFQIREDTHFYATIVQPTIRRAALELGRRMLQVGALDDVEDVFHIRLEEIDTFGKTWPPSEQVIADVRALVARRKAKRKSLANKPMVDPRLLMISNPQRGEDVILNGSSGSPGVAIGLARIVHDVSEFGRLQAGEVLVAPITNPAWTPLFQRAAAVVVDTGGAASHAAIVAREYGIPAVMGTMNGTQVLKDGQWIRVDGSRGLVLKAEEPK